MKFVIATRDYDGLGFAIRLQDEGHDVIVATSPDPSKLSDPDRRRAFDKVGQGLVDKRPLDKILEQREQMRDWYWIWDFNHSVGENESLRREGFKVLGGGEFANSMEHDRAACLEFTSTYGLEPPPSFSFSDPKEALKFCKTHAGTAYVYKPDNGAKHETFLPESEEPAEANEELCAHLASIECCGNFILQERKEGVETNVEVWFQNGDPIFAFMQLECKRRMVGDLGELTGCAFDFVFTTPLESKGVQETVGKLYPAYNKMNYTGFGDANFIAARDGVWFFEKCERFGYNSHVNLLYNLSRRGVGEVIAGLTDGTLRPDFSGGFGASCTMSTRENSAGGKAIVFPPRLGKDIFWWDVYKSGDLYLTAGYDTDGSVLIVNGYGYTMPTAWENLMKKTAQIKFPYRAFRTDGDKTNYPTSPIRRYEALRAMGYL